MDITKYFPHHMWVRRSFKGIKDEWYNIKSFFQRGRLGWANCDTWNIDNYLGRILPAMLRHLADNHCGMPMEYMDKYSDEDKASEAWAADLNHIADMIEYANSESDDHNKYAEDYWAIALHRKLNELMPEGKEWLRDAYYNESKTIYENQQAAIKEAMTWLGEHWFSLWD